MGLREKLTRPQLEIETISGYCPVQAEGTCCGGHRFYFRARGSAWTVEISRHRSPTHPIHLPAEEVWMYGEPYGEGPFDAGYLSDDEARDFIGKAVRLFAADPAAPDGNAEAGKG